MDVKKKLDIFMNETFVHEKLEDIIGDRFGRYSKYIIQERAIPDVRDGLKPVQRRILYAMNQMGITSKAQFKKSARITGEVMGKYHPHGDSSIYEAMVRLSQWWKMGVTLVEMHGNNGSIDGDDAAAMRYTEARLSKNADFLLKDIDKNTVPFVPNFDEEEIEPTVLPAKFPNLLVNGSVGISSGYATNIPTHNLNEVVNAVIYRIDHPKMTLDDLLKIMPGPDFPTGGIVQGLDGIKQAFEIGSGSIVIKSKITFENIASDQKRIVVTEIPYEINKAKLVEKIDQLRIDKKVDGIQEVRDESDRTGLRIAIDLKKGANEQAILNYLLKNTDLQIRYSYNMVSICDQKPLKLGVISILDYYILHQKDVITNRTNYELAKALKRLHIVLGLIKMVSILDEVIKTIRASKNKANSKENLISKFDFTEEQAEAIVTMQLYRLSSTDILALEEEQKTLNENIVIYNNILDNEKELLKVIKEELKEVNKTIITPRMSEIEHEVSEIKIDESELISDEQTVVCLSREGYIKRTSLKSYNTSKQNGLKENDSVLFLEEVSTINTLLMFTNIGNFLFLPVYKIDEVKFKDLGTYISSIIQISPQEKIIACFVIKEFKPSITVMLCTKNGSIKQTLLSEFEISRYSKAVKAMRIADDDLVVSADLIENPLEILVSTKNAEVLRFRSSDVSLYGTTAGGIKAAGLKPKDYVVSACYANKNDDLLVLSARGNIKRIRVDSLNLSKRGRATTPVIKLTKTNPHNLVDAKTLTPNQYKEDVPINIMYTLGNDKINAYSIKYSATDSGKNILDETLGEPLKMSIPKSKEKDELVSSDYLMEKTIFNFEDSFEEKPLKTAKQINILDELDKILIDNNIKTKEVVKENKVIKTTDSEANKETEIIRTTDNEVIRETSTSTIVRRKRDNDYFMPKASSEDNKKEENPRFTKVSLFDEEE